MNRTSQDMKNLFDALVYEERLKVVKAETEIHIEGKDKCLAAVRTLESLGYTYSGGSWVAPLSDNQRALNPYPGIVRIGNTVFPPGVSLEAAEQYMRDKLQASEGGSTDE